MSKTILERKENVLSLIAFAVLKNKNKQTTQDNIIAEKGRIERVAERYYVKTDKEYNTFIIDWLKENARRLVYTNEFSYDVSIPDDVKETKLDLFLR